MLSEIGKYCKRAAVIREGKILVSDSVEKLAHTGIKKVILRGITEIPSVDCAIDMKLENEVLSFLYDKSAEELIKTLSTLRFTDVNITEPDLEEIFMHYYRREEN